MQVFIGYRRDDAGGTAGRLYDRVAARYGRRNVFRDVDAIDAGADFVASIEASLTAADVMLVVIGPDWLTIADDTGRPRLDDPADYVRTEVRMALDRSDLRVVPVLVEGAEMPQPDDLPDELRPLATRNAVELRNARFDDDVDHLLDQIGSGGLLRSLLPEHRPLVVGAGTVLLLAVLLGVRLILGGPDPLAGDFNFAVAEFGATGEADRGAAEALSQAAFGVIEGVLSDFEASGDFTNAVVAPPSLTGPVEGSTPEKRAEQAAELAARLDADVVMMGNLEAGGGVSRFDAELYLSDRNLRNAEELAGAYSLGRTELATTDPLAVTREVTAKFEARAEAIAELVVGLSYFSVSDFRSAYDHLLVAEAAWGPNPDGREVVLVLLGDAAGELGPTRWDEARDYYRRALSLDPDYARAQFGVAEVDFLAARGAECSGDPGQDPADVATLEAVAEQFRRVARSEAPPLSFLDLRSQVEIGRVYLCLALVGEDRLTDATAQLEGVVAEYDGSNQRIRNIVAEALRSLALVDILRGDYSAALDRYRRGIDLSLDPTVEATMWAARGDVYSCYLADPAAAEREYRQAETLSGRPPPRADC